MEGGREGVAGRGWQGGVDRVDGGRKGGVEGGRDRVDGGRK